MPPAPERHPTGSEPLNTIPDPAASTKKPPRFEIYPKEKIPYIKPIPTHVIPQPNGLPRVAIIIDDLGYDSRIAQQFLDLDATLTFSILPYSPQQSKIAYAAQKKGLEAMLHLPMEPEEYPAIDPGPGVLLTSMSPDELIGQLEKNIMAIPHITGVNNHMGSKLTANSPKMRQVFTILKKRGLFFIDSRTTTKTLCRSSARLLQIPFAERDVFLDHVLSPATIRKQLQYLVQVAEKQGAAVGIGHPHTVTLNVLKEELPMLEERVQLGARVQRLLDEQARLKQEIPSLEAELAVKSRELDKLSRTVALSPPR
jgi:polysaccharide deacetylase 2 family uncharacterized protein YibQ